MRGLIIFALVAGALFWVGKNVMNDEMPFSIDTLIGGGPKTAAEGRVKQVLEGLKTAGDGNGVGLQTAICQWDQAVNVIQDQPQFEGAYDAFVNWREAFDIGHRKIADYAIIASEVVQEQPPVVIVSGTIEGRPFKMRVPDKQRISWMR